MDLFQLKVFSLAAKTANFSKVATAMFVSPPSITRYISSLEQEIGHTLFVRDGNQLVLTDFGSNFAVYVDEMLAKEDALNRFLCIQNDITVYNIAVANHMSTAPKSFFKDLLETKQSFESKHEDAKIVYRFLNYNDIHSTLENGTTDLSLLSILNCEIPTTLPEYIMYEKINHFSYSLVIPSRISKHAQINDFVKNIQAIAFLNSPAPRSIVKKFIFDYGISPRMIEVPSLSLGLMKAATGECATFVTNDMLDCAEYADVDIYKLDDNIYSNGLYALWKKDGKEYIGELVKCLKDYAKTPE